MKTLCDLQRARMTLMKGLCDPHRAAMRLRMTFCDLKRARMTLMKGLCDPHRADLRLRKTLRKSQKASLSHEATEEGAGLQALVGILVGGIAARGDSGVMMDA